MSEAFLSQQLRRLRDVILQERECAKQLDMAGLERTVEEKSALISTLSGLGEAQLPAELHALAGEIRKENRRNAYLFWSSLTWVRETMRFYGGQLGQKSYGQTGRAVTGVSAGNLLSGKV